MASLIAAVPALAKLSTPVWFLFLASFYLGISLSVSVIEGFYEQHGSWLMALFWLGI